MVELEAGRSPWRTLRALERNKRSRKFARLVADLRAKQALHNDDTTLLRVEVA